MATFTSFLGLRKPATSDNVNVALDINDNMDDIDTAIQTLDTRLGSIDAAWTTYVPTVTNVTTSSIVARYKRIGSAGKTIIAQVRLNISGTPSGIVSVSLPVTAHASISGVGNFPIGVAMASDASTTGKFFAVVVFNGTSATSVKFWPHTLGDGDQWDADNPLPWVSGDALDFTVTYEAA